MNSLAEVAFWITHPFSAARAKSRQIGVKIEHEAPPPGSTIEEFPQLPLPQAAALLNLAREPKGSGVQLSDWSSADQERLLQGKRPVGVPNHRNV
jgi:hypothetical protein